MIGVFISSNVDLYIYVTDLPTLYRVCMYVCMYVNSFFGFVVNLGNPGSAFQIPCGKHFLRVLGWGSVEVWFNWIYVISTPTSHKYNTEYD